MSSTDTRNRVRWSAWRVLGLLIVVALGVNLFWTNWEVVTDYEWMGDRQVRKFFPPASPIFLPPCPEDFGEKTWKAFQFFYMGGGGGPIGEPHLRPNWELMAIKIVVIVLLGFPLALIEFRHLEQSRKNPCPTRRRTGR